MAKVSRSFLVGVDISENGDMSILVVAERRKNDDGRIIPTVINTICGDKAEELYKELITPPLETGRPYSSIPTSEIFITRSEKGE